MPRTRRRGRRLSMAEPAACAHPAAASPGLPPAEVPGARPACASPTGPLSGRSPPSSPGGDVPQARRSHRFRGPVHVQRGWFPCGSGPATCGRSRDDVEAFRPNVSAQDAETPSVRAGPSAATRTCSRHGRGAGDEIVVVRATRARTAAIVRCRPRLERGADRRPLGPARRDLGRGSGHGRPIREAARPSSRRPKCWACHFHEEQRAVPAACPLAGEFLRQPMMRPRFYAEGFTLVFRPAAGDRGPRPEVSPQSATVGVMARYESATPACARDCDVEQGPAVSVRCALLRRGRAGCAPLNREVRHVPGDRRDQKALRGRALRYAPPIHGQP